MPRPGDMKIRIEITTQTVVIRVCSKREKSLIRCRQSGHSVRRAGDIASGQRAGLNLPSSGSIEWLLLTAARMPVVRLLTCDGDLLLAM